jgi:hypothetical protein
MVTASLDLRIAGYTDETSQPFYGELLEALARIPGATNAAIAAQVPLAGSRLGLGRIRIPERQNERFDADWNVVSPGFFETLKMPIVQGRAFTAADRAGAPRVAIVNEAFARAAWPGESAIGRQLDMDQGDAEVIGVARDARLHIIGNPAVPFIFVPLYQNPFLRTEIFVRHHDTVTIAAIAPGIRQTVRATVATRWSLASCCAAVSGLPASPEAKPHCGLTSPDRRAGTRSRQAARARRPPRGAGS